MHALIPGAAGSAERALPPQTPNEAPPVEVRPGNTAVPPRDHTERQVAPSGAMGADGSVRAPAGWDGERLACVLTGVWTAMGLVLWVMFPMLSTVLLPLCAIAPLGWYVA